MATCRIYGTIEDGAEQPVEGVKIQFIPAALPSVDASTGKGVHPIELGTITSSTGEFEIELSQNKDFVVIINSMGLKEKIRVPAETEKKLFELTGQYTSGDSTPTDTGEDNW